MIKSIQNRIATQGTDDQLYDVVAFNPLGEPCMTVTEGAPFSGALAAARGFNAGGGRQLTAVVLPADQGVIESEAGTPVSEAQDVNPVEPSIERAVEWQILVFSNGLGATSVKNLSKRAAWLIWKDWDHNETDTVVPWPMGVPVPAGVADDNVQSPSDNPVEIEATPAESAEKTWSVYLVTDGEALRPGPKCTGLNRRVVRGVCKNFLKNLDHCYNAIMFAPDGMPEPTTIRVVEEWTDNKNEIDELINKEISVYWIQAERDDEKYLMTEACDLDTAKSLARKMDSDGRKPKLFKSIVHANDIWHNRESVEFSEAAEELDAVESQPERTLAVHLVIDGKAQETSSGLSPAAASVMMQEWFEAGHSSSLMFCPEGHAVPADLGDDIKQSVEEATAAAIRGDYAVLASVGLRIALTRFLGHVMGLVKAGKIQCASDVGGIAKALERLCCQVFNGEVDTDIDFYDWNYQAFEDGRVGDSRDEEVEQALTQWFIDCMVPA